jgi:hypothetical protein
LPAPPAGIKTSTLSRRLAMLTYWIRPTVLALFWIVLAGLTLAELGTLR